MASHHFVPQSQQGPQVLPLRRPHVAQPPTLLTTSLNNAHNLGHGLGLTGVQTPLSTTTMAVRSPVAYNGTYNPQQWGRINGDGMGEMASSSTLSPMHARQSSRNMAYAPRLRGPDGK
jgi:hypothetical protein